MTTNAKTNCLPTMSRMPFFSSVTFLLIRDMNALIDIFCPGVTGKLSEVVSDNRRFAYYNSADTAKSIIENQQIWLRNATVMNDFSEISYGLSLAMNSLSGPYGDDFRIPRAPCFQRHGQSRPDSGSVGAELAG